ncbi:unnamed protein product, partial [Prorocentrum cordatum]
MKEVEATLAPPCPAVAGADVAALDTTIEELGALAAADPRGGCAEDAGFDGRGGAGGAVALDAEPDAAVPRPPRRVPRAARMPRAAPKPPLDTEAAASAAALAVHRRRGAASERTAEARRSLSPPPLAELAAIGAKLAAAE